MGFNEYRWISTGFSKAFANTRYLNKRVKGAYGLITIIAACGAVLAYDEVRHRKALTKTINDLNEKIDGKEDKQKTEYEVTEEKSEQ